MANRNTPRQCAEEIISTLRAAGHTALLAGGCVRDLLLGCAPKDFDVATDARPERVADLFRRTRQVGAQFGVVLVRLHGCDIEVATFRTDGVYSDGRRPDSITYGSAEEDARRRDFTINGMFMDPDDGRVIDYVGGKDDISARLVRAIGDPDARFEEDHLRMLRAVRFAARLAFDIEAATLAAMRRHAAQLSRISAERVREELKMILGDARRSRGWRLIALTGLANHLIRNVALEEVDLERIERRLAALPRDASVIVSIASILRSMAPDVAGRACRSFKCSNEEVEGVAWLIRQRNRLEDLDGFDLADLKRLKADARFADLAALFEADLSADGSSMAPHETLLRKTVDLAADLPPPLVTGDDLLSRGVPQGPIYTRVLESVFRDQLNEKISTREEAVHLLNALLEKE